MDEQGAYPGFAPSAYGAPAPFVPAPLPEPGAAPQFRPLSTGEVLDRTFALYRKRFWLFVGIGMLPAGMLLLSSSIRLIFLATTNRTNVLRPMPGQLPMNSMMSSMLLLQAYTLPATILFLVAYGISHAATVDAVNRIAEGSETAVRAAFDAVRGRWLRWCGIVLRQFWSAMWPMLPGIVGIFVTVGILAVPRFKSNPVLIGSLFALAWALLIAGVVFGVLNYVRNTLAVAASVSENLGVGASMRRSKMLVAGRKGRIFLALLLLYALQMVVAAVQVPLLFAAMSLRGGAFIAVQAVVLLVQFVAVALVSPVSSIAFTLFYIDERVRREGFDIELLMRRTLPAAAPAYVPEI